MQTQPRIILSGITGLDKEKVAHKFRNHIAQKLGVKGDDTSIPIISADVPQLPKCLGMDPSARSAIFHQVYETTVAKLEAAKSNESVRCIVVPMHMTFMNTDRILSPLSWIPDPTFNFVSRDDISLLLTFLQKFEPTHIINLIDDVHYIQKRIKQHREPSHLRLADILNWREQETLVSDFAANYVIPFRKRHENPRRFRYERSPIVAVRHKCDMLYKYIFQPDIPRIYASFLISEVHRSKPKRSTSLREQISLFTGALSEHFCVFNPLTIDEKPLATLLTDANDRKALKRWPIPHKDTLTSDPVKDMFGIGRSEVLEVCSEHPKDKRTAIDRQVAARDYRLIDQADCLVVYRPTNKFEPKAGDEWGTGCWHEWNYANGEKHVRPNLHVYFVVDESDHSIKSGVNPEGSALTDGRPGIEILSFKGLDEPANLKAAMKVVVRRIKDNAHAMTSARFNPAELNRKPSMDAQDER